LQRFQEFTIEGFPNTEELIFLAEDQTGLLKINLSADEGLGCIESFCCHDQVSATFSTKFLRHFLQLSHLAEKVAIRVSIDSTLYVQFMIAVGPQSMFAELIIPPMVTQE
jgi:hypothetical protein